MKTIKVYLAIAAIFLLGMLSGGMIVVQIVQSRIDRIASSSTEDVYELFLERMEKKLNLTDPQKEQISAIFQDAAKEMEPLRSELRAKLLMLTKENSPKIQAHLDPKQQETFQEMVNSIMERLNLDESLEPAG